MCSVDIAVSTSITNGCVQCSVVDNVSDHFNSDSANRWLFFKLCGHINGILNEPYIETIIKDKLKCCQRNLVIFYLLDDKSIL